MVRHTENWRIIFHLSRLGPPCLPTQIRIDSASPFRPHFLVSRQKLLGLEYFGILDMTRMDYENAHLRQYITLKIPVTRMSFSFDNYFDASMRLAFFFQTGIPSAAWDIEYRICYIPETTHIAIWTIDIKSLTPASEMKMLPSAWYSHN